MNYQFKPESFDRACSLWEHHVLQAAQSQPGFVRMQFLTNSPNALAIGTWQARNYAEAFMQTGVFKRLMAELDSLCAHPPEPHIWDLRYFAQT